MKSTLVHCEINGDRHNSRIFEKLKEHPNLDVQTIPCFSLCSAVCEKMLFAQLDRSKFVKGEDEQIFLENLKKKMETKGATQS